MHPSSPHDDAEPDERIVALVNEFLDRRQAGEDLTVQRFVAEHPDLAEQLRPALEGLPVIDRARTLAGHHAAADGPRAAAKLPAVEGYEVIGEIGRGGMGVVYKALQASTKRIVALKVMRGGPLASQTARRRFEREVELAARLRHPNIVSVLEGGHAADRPYYAMEYVDGTPLKRYLTTTASELSATLGLFERICEAVDYAHRHGVIHRDLKPANVLVDEDGSPRILDFGLAKAAGGAEAHEGLTPQLSVSGLVLGTLSYLSPEQAAGVPDEIDARTDVYALGVMLFEALTGSLPFDTTGQPADVIQRMLETPPIRPSSLSERVDDDLEALILKALEKDRARRYQSAAEMAGDIRRYLQGEPLLARQPSGFYVLRKRLRKHRRPIVLGAVVVSLGLVGLLAGVWWQQYSRGRELAQGRRKALRIQQGLERRPSIHATAAQSLFEQYPRLPEATLVQAQALYRRSEEQYQAIAFLKDVLSRDPSCWACRALLAEFYRAAGDAEQARQLHEQAERDAPDTTEAWYLGSFATLDPQLAARCVQEVVRRETGHVLAWERLAWLCLRTGDLDGALEGAEKLVELGEDFQYWTLFKGAVLEKLDRCPEAMELYAQLGANKHLYQAQAYRRIKAYDKALECYDRVLERWAEQDDKSGALWHFYQRATPLWILGRCEEALKDYAQFRALHGRPWFSDARAFLILCQLGRQPEAEQTLNAALSEVQDHWLRQVLRCLDRQLTPEQLVADGGARDDPERLCEAYYYAGEVCLLTDQSAQAREYFQQCVQTGVASDPDAAVGTPMNEYELAQWRLATLFAGQGPTSRP